jgi:hypothetical protein
MAKAKEALSGDPRIRKMQFVEEHRETVKRLEQQHANEVAQAKATKSLLDAAKSRLNQLIDIGEDSLKQQQPLEFDAAATEKKPKTRKEKAGANGQALGEKLKGKDGPKAWRSRPITDAISVGVVTNQLEQLSDPRVSNLGELVLWMKKNILASLPGVSEDKAGLAADQLAEFWKANPHYVV